MVALIKNENKSLWTSSDAEGGEEGVSTGGGGARRRTVGEGQGDHPGTCRQSPGIL